MKIRHPLLISAIGFVLSWIVRLWMRTIRYRHWAPEPNLMPDEAGISGRYIYAFWHEDMFVPSYRYARPDLHVLISRHADGRLVAQAIRWLGLNVVAGSTHRGAAEALLKLMQVARESHIAITPDGPRGPRQCVQAGIVYLAAKTGLPIVPVGFGYSRAWRAGSWDRMAVPMPFSRSVGVSLPPIVVPPITDKKELEIYRQQVEDRLREASRIAHVMAGGPATDNAADLDRASRDPQGAIFSAP